MNKKYNLVMASLLLLTGCGQEVLDFRNAEIAHGKVYANNANKPFTGIVTNAPLNVLPNSSAFNTLMQSFKLATQDSDYTSLFTMLGVANIMNNNESAVLCNLNTQDGMLNGETVCGIVKSDLPLLSINFKNGNADGIMRLFNINDSGKVVAEGTASDDKINGLSKFYSPKTQNLVHTINWNNGITEGLEEGFDAATGKKLLSISYTNGKINGTVNRYSADGNTLIATGEYISGSPVGIHKYYDDKTGKLIKEESYDAGQVILIKTWDSNGTPIGEQRYRNGQPLPASTKSSDQIDQCVDLKAQNFHHEMGEDTPINYDVIQEWQDECSQGNLS